MCTLELIPPIFKMQICGPEILYGRYRYIGNASDWFRWWNCNQNWPMYLNMSVYFVSFKFIVFLNRAQMPAWNVFESLSRYISTHNLRRPGLQRALISHRYSSVRDAFNFICMWKQKGKYMFLLVNKCFTIYLYSLAYSSIFVSSAKLSSSSIFTFSNASTIVWISYFARCSLATAINLEMISFSQGSFASTKMFKQ